MGSQAQAQIGPVPAALLCRTSDWRRTTMETAGALAEALAGHWHVTPTRIGEVGDGRRGDWQEDLRDARTCLEEAARHVGGELDAGRTPVLCSGHCPPCITTLPAVVSRAPAARILWIDAHPDFNSPDTTPSRFLGGMCLSAACGVWPAGAVETLPRVPTSQVLVVGARDVDPGEGRLLRERGIPLLQPADVPGALGGADVFVHLDLDVLDPAVMPGLDFPVPVGLSLAEVELLLAGLGDAGRLLGIEITDCSSLPAVPDVAAMLVRGLGSAGVGTTA